MGSGSAFEIDDNSFEFQPDCRLSAEAESAWRIYNSFLIEEAPIKGDDKDLTSEGGTCGFCNEGGAVVLHDGLYVCLGCNVVADRMIDASAEWRFFGYESTSRVDPTRCGMPTNELLPEASMGTMIGTVPGEMYQMRILRKYQSWTSMPYRERSLHGVFETLSLNASNNGIPSSIVTEAKNLYKQASQSGVTRGDSRHGLIASSIYVACKRANVPRSAKEIAKMFHLHSSTMTRGCKRFQELLPVETSNTVPKDFVSRFVSRLDVSREVKDLCFGVIDLVKEYGLLEENSPPSVAASCIFMVCDASRAPNIDKKRVAAECDVSVVTISRCVKKLLPYRDQLIKGAAAVTAP